LEHSFKNSKCILSYSVSTFFPPGTKYEEENGKNTMHNFEAKVSLKWAMKQTNKMDHILDLILDCSQCCERIRILNPMDPHHFGKPDPDPLQSQKPYPVRDSQKNEKPREIRRSQ
jgi:hypothetical protein